MGLPFRPVAFRGHCVQHDLAKTCLATALLPFEKTSVFRVIVGIAQLGQIADRLFFSRSECLQEEYEEVDCLSPTIRNACKKEEEGDCLSPSIIPHLSEEGDCLSPSIYLSPSIPPPTSAVVFFSKESGISSPEIVATA